MNTLELTKKLISCPSVTPKDEGAQVLLGEFLRGVGFECHHLSFGKGDEEVPNLFARIGKGGPHLCYAGHTDVVPSGPEEQWTFGPFNPEVKDGVLYGRGASDMKGSVAAFAVAAAEFIKTGEFKGSISLLITGDEEGVAINGTVKVLEWMKENGHVPDVAIVGEPTNPKHFGQEIKIGRRGSLNGHITVKGKQGHVAYQQLADNPVPKMVQMLDALVQYEFDEGSEFFPPTNLEITTIDVGNPATNVIPAGGWASFNIRFNDQWSSKSLKAKITALLDACAHDYEIKFEGNAESFITQPGEWSDLVQAAVEEVSGKVPECTTSGGTSDARFIVNYCPVIECGGVNESIHQIDENAAVADLEMLTKIYGQILERYFR